MTTPQSFETTFEKSLSRAYRLASQRLRSPLGGHTSEDVVSVLIEKALRQGKRESEIQELLSGPHLYRLLDNAKNDIYRSETAVKRGRGESVMPYEDAEPFLVTLWDDPELELVRKEDAAHMNDVLARLFEEAELSETQLEILRLDLRGWSNKQIAHHLGMPVNAVYSRRSEALRKLAAAAAQLTQDQSQGE